MEQFLIKHKKILLIRTKSTSSTLHEYYVEYYVARMLYINVRQRKSLSSKCSLLDSASISPTDSKMTKLFKLGSQEAEGLVFKII